MSGAGIFGIVYGGIVGGAVGGPWGAFYGASIGFSLGMMIDPITPDISGGGDPLPVGAELMLNTVGSPLSDLVGTGQITGHLLCFGKERNEAIMVQPEGGKGGSSPDPYVSGYKYYMSWAVGIVAGPLDKLYTIYRNEDIVWEGELECPVSGGQETIVIENMGSAIFYFGTDDQVANTDVGELIGDDTLNSPYRHFCWCFFDDCYIGEYNRCPTMKFVVGKYPMIAFSVNNIIQSYDYNPMHAVWYMLHDLAGLPESWLHTADFTSAAATLAGETRGICCLFINQQTTLNYLENVTNHIDGLIRYGSDGKFHPKLIREDYVVDDLPLIDENVMLEDPTLNRKGWVDTINEMKVQYTELIASYPFLQGPWKAAMSSPETSFVYVYDIMYKAVIKLSTEVLPPACHDALVITEHDLDYDMGYGNPGAQRGGYCMNPAGDRLWYLIRDGMNCELVEVDISSYYMKLVSKTVLPSLLASGEKISDGCSDGTHTYWSTTLVAGRVIKIKNSDHSIVIDTTFNYPIVGSGGEDSCIESLTIEGSDLYWIYSRDHIGCAPEYNACRHWIKSGNDFVQDFDVIYCNSGLSAPYWQNLIRYIDGNLYIHQAYHPFCGAFYQTDLSFTAFNAVCKLYLLNIMGLCNNQIFILTYEAPYITYLKCVDVSDLADLSSIDVSQYTGHPIGDGRTWSGTSALSTYGNTKVVSLFTYDEAEKVNIMTCFGANELLMKLSEDAVQSRRVITYGS